MIVIIKLLVCLLLLFNGLTALYGGWSLMVYPDGSGLNISIDALKYSPFKDYFIPGICLFILNGIGSFFVLTITVIGKLKTSLLIKVQGSILLAWVVIQSLLFHSANALQFIYGVIGFALFVLGIFLGTRERRVSERRSSFYF